MQARSDQMLARAWLAGDASAERQLLRRLRPKLRRYFASRTLSEPEDLVQQTLAACCLALPRFRGDSSFRTFLFRIAHHQLLAERRRARRARQLIEQAQVLWVDATGEVAREHAADGAVTDALNALPYELRRVIELAFWSHRTQSEIAELLALPLGTVASRMRRAKLRLRASLTAQRRAGQQEKT
jgi:RNA polymerase sigma factor (sigma-70 family)